MIAAFRLTVWLGFLGMATASCAPEPSRPAPLPDDVSANWHDSDVPWEPGVHLPMRADVRHGPYRDVRGLIHAHSVFSHDACDGKPTDDNGDSNAPCLADFRDDLCAVGHDFVYLTDHPDRFAAHEFPEVLLFDPERGDKLVFRDKAPVANVAQCKDRQTWIMAGCEGDTMAVGLNRHAGASPAEREDAYRGKASPQSFDLIHQAGGLVLAQHTEDWSVEQLTSLPFDGLEMYNVHANLMTEIKSIATLLPLLLEQDKAPAPDLLLLPLLKRDPRYSERWGSALAQGAKLVGTMGTDCHQNTFTLELADGQRVDRYRRVMGWFTNHVLTETAEDGTYDERQLREAISAGRLYGTFDMLGHPEGFDFHARVGGSSQGPGERIEMGGEAALNQGVELVVRLPHVAKLQGDVTVPAVEARLLRAKSGGFEQLATSTEAVTRWPIQSPGVYLVEVWIRPSHLRGHLGALEELADAFAPWVLTNPIYVRAAR